MFKINFFPQYRGDKLELIADEYSLIVNGDILDFSDMVDGSSYANEAIDNNMVVGSVSRIDGEIHITVVLPYSLLSPPHSVTFPEAVIVSVNGRVDLPTDGLIEGDENAAE